jgi:hypothetical protein
MKKFKVVWSVMSVANGSGDNISNGDRIREASGSVVKEGNSADELKEELTKALMGAFPKVQMRGTYEFNRVYNIDIEEIECVT